MNITVLLLCAFSRCSGSPVGLIDGKFVSIEQAQEYIRSVGLSPPAKQGVLALPFVASATRPTPWQQLKYESITRKSIAKLHQDQLQQPLDTNIKGTCTLCGVREPVENPAARKPIVRCVVCNVAVHPSCFIPALSIPPFLQTQWRCPKCQLCHGCNKHIPDATLMICQQCGEGWHPQCTTQSITIKSRSSSSSTSSSSASSSSTISTDDVSFICAPCAFIPDMSPAERAAFDERVKKQKEIERLRWKKLWKEKNKSSSSSSSNKKKKKEKKRKRDKKGKHRHKHGSSHGSSTTVDSVDSASVNSDAGSSLADDNSSSGHSSHVSSHTSDRHHKRSKKHKKSSKKHKRHHHSSSSESESSDDDDSDDSSSDDSSDSSSVRRRKEKKKSKKRD